MTLNPLARYWSIPQFKKRQYTLLSLVQPLHYAEKNSAYWIMPFTHYFILNLQNYNFSFRNLGFPKAGAVPTVYTLRLNNTPIRVVNNGSPDI